MILQKYNVDRNLNAYRKHFNICEILKELENQFALKQWLLAMSKLNDLGKESRQRITDIQKNLLAWYSDTAMEVDQKLPCNCSIALANSFREWGDTVPEKSRSKYFLLCRILLGLIELAEYEAVQEDIQQLYAFIQKKGFFAPKKLELRGTDSPQLYYGDELIGKLQTQNAEWFQKNHLCTAEFHPDTGFLGIDTEGNLVNGSAFTLPPLKKKAVKVQLNAMRYVILLEDGTLYHNLPAFAEIPETPVKDVSLIYDSLKFTSME